MSVKGALQLFLVLALVQLAFQYCYKVNMMSFRLTETPYYHFTMEMFKNNSIFAVTTVLKDIEVPLWNLVLVQRTPKDVKVHYNGTFKVCDFMKFVKRVRAFKEVASFLLRPESSNMSLTCPLLKGVYVMQNVQVPSDMAILKFIYAPNSIYTLYGAIMSQTPDGRVDRLGTYEINGTLVKRC